MLKYSTCLAILATIFSFILTAKANDDDDAKFSVGLNQFAVDLLKTLSKPENNVIISPTSIATTLAMLQQIIKTNSSLEELEKALHLTTEESRTGFHGMIESIKNEQGTSIVRLANGFVMKDDFVLDDDIIKNITTDFDMKVRRDTFQDLAATAKSINDEIANATNNIITDMINADDLKDAIAVLYSAIYFKATWLSQFSGLRTQEGSFHINDQKVIKIPIMNKSARARLICGTDNELGMQWIKLPYRDPFNGPSYSMLLALPLQRFGLDHLIQNFTAQNLAEAVSKGYSCKVTLSLPKFKLKEKINCQETLEKIGVRSIFTASDDRSFKISKILHDAFISVAEEGTEAAAATAVIAHKYSLIDLPIVTFNADQPFLFAVMNDKLKVPLFIGKVANPEWN